MVPLAAKIGLSLERGTTFFEGSGVGHGVDIPIPEKKSDGVRNCTDVGANLFFYFWDHFWSKIDPGPRSLGKLWEALGSFGKLWEALGSSCFGDQVFDFGALWRTG